MTDFSLSPFDLSGPSFLIFYIGAVVIVAIAVKLAIDAAEQGAPPALPLSDPYQIAWLRGGTPEAARVAVLALTDRGLVTVNGDTLVNSRPNRPFVREPIESAILARCAHPGIPATAVLDDPAVVRACSTLSGALGAPATDAGCSNASVPISLVRDRGCNSARHRPYQD
jgi:uncharacterized protein (TIGR04222 family)